MLLWNLLSGLPRLTPTRLIRQQSIQRAITLLVLGVLLAPASLSPALNVSTASASSSPGSALTLGSFSNANAISSGSKASIRPVSAGSGPGQGSVALNTYYVRPAEGNGLIQADATPSQLEEEARQHQQDELEAVLKKLAEAGQAGAYAFDTQAGAFRAELSDTAQAELAANPLVASIDPASASALSTGSQSAGLTGPYPSGATVQSVSSVVFIQAYSPFMWGHASVGGLTVTLTLENSSGTVIGVACQTLQSSYVQIDKNQLYYETVFIGPSNATSSTACSSDQPVMIMPGDRVHVVTSGLDPVTNTYQTEDKRVVVDDVRAWTSYAHDSVSGTTTANMPVIVTVSSSYLSLSNYLTPGSNMTYAELTSNGSGNFSTSTFRTTTNSTYNAVNLQQGSNGFVRVQHQDGSEVYTVHGQNAFVLENSNIVHAWAFSLPWAPWGLDPGVTVSRPTPVVSATLTSSGESESATVTSNPYSIFFSTSILGGDSVEVSEQWKNGSTVSADHSPVMSIAVDPLTAAVDLAHNVVTGTGPSSIGMTLGLGRIDGYISHYSTFTYIQQPVTTTVSGQYTSAPFGCGSGSTVILQPGSFGYIGFEDSHGNFIYASYAAPTNYVMSDFTFVEGWVADGNARPTVTVRDGNRNVKYQATVIPTPIWLVSQQLYLNVYYNTLTSQFIEPGDTVTVVAGSRTDTIPVDNVTAYLNVDADTVVGQAPAGDNVRVVPASDRSARREVAADASGNYTAGNPFSRFSSYSCTDSSTTENFTPGNSGRAYVKHNDSDQNQVFAVYGRSMNVTEDENFVEIFPFEGRDLDWFGNPASQIVTVTLTPSQGAPVTVSCAQPSYPTPSSQCYGGDSGKADIYITNSGQKVLIRAWDSLSAVFNEGLPGGATRQATLTMNSLPLITGSPDIDRNTVAGVGPQSWSGTATLNTVPANAVSISPRTYTAYGPFGFQSSSGTPIILEAGYSGVVYFSDSTAHRVQIAWAATGSRLEITGHYVAGMTKVCGIRAPANTTVNIHDATTGDVIIGTGTSDGQGNFCVTVSPLYNGQVLMAEANGEYSQPVVVGVFLLFLPITMKSAPGP